ncbi:MAG: alpha-galactosidase [Capsulimonadales bacterium]|nr:alpha-galactosidase [Capsulimonadales bacterium]
MTKIVIIGAGSGFGAELSCDILSLPELKDATIALCDIHEGRLAAITRFMRRVVEANHLGAKIVSGTDRRELLDGADFVVTSISVGGAAYAGYPHNIEVEIPQKYGIEQSVADTIGVGGIFRFLRTAPVQWAICRDMEELCPDALLLNYTNPMCMLTWLHSRGSRIANVGLCHSIQHTSNQIADYIGIARGELSYLAAGINHQCWFLKLDHRGEDVYPRLRNALNDPDTVAKDNVRFEMMRHFGYFVSESTVHCSEYHPYFRRTPELLEQFQLSRRTVAAEPNYARRPYLSDPENAPLRDLTVSVEYASQIIRAVVADRPFRFWGNVMNHGLIDNLPNGCCVEVPCLVDGQGVHPCHVGSLPPQLAHLNLTNIAPQELAVRAVQERNREYAYHAVLLDPLARAVCSLDRLRVMFDELWDAEGDLLAYFRA